MIKQRAIIVHGKPSKETYFNSNLPSASNGIWIPWLQQQLQLMGISTQTPEMLEAYRPDYRIWRETFEQFTVDEQTILIGHSCGGGFLVQWLSENSGAKTSDVFLVAPAFGDQFNPEAPYEEPLRGGFFDFEIDKKLLGRVKSLNVLYSDNDSVRVNTAVSMIREALPGANFYEFPGYGHFRGKRDMADDAFPELLELIRTTSAN